MLCQKLAIILIYTGYSLKYAIIRSYLYLFELSLTKYSESNSQVNILGIYLRKTQRNWWVF